MFRFGFCIDWISLFISFSKESNYCQFEISQKVFFGRNPMQFFQLFAKLLNGYISRITIFFVAFSVEESFFDGFYCRFYVFLVSSTCFYCFTNNILRDSYIVQNRNKGDLVLCGGESGPSFHFETAAMNKKRFTFALSNRSTSVRCWESAFIHKKVVINTFFAVLHYKLKMSIHTNQEKNSLERMKKRLCFLSIGGRLFNRLDCTKFILVSFSSHMNLFYLAGIVVVVVVFSSLHWNCFPFL